MSQLGGRSACYDAAAVMEALCCAPELDISNGACAALMAAGGPSHMVKVRGGGGGSGAIRTVPHTLQQQATPHGAVMAFTRVGFHESESSPTGHT